MRTQKILDDITAAVARVLPEPLSAELKRNLRAALQSAFERLDLVTREELEVQEQVLARTRAKLQALEQKIHALEQSVPPHRPQ